METLQAKLLAAEEAYNQRLAAETELLGSQLEAERSTTLDLQQQLGRREQQLGALQQQVGAQGCGWLCGRP